MVIRSRKTGTRRRAGRKDVHRTEGGSLTRGEKGNKPLLPRAIRTVTAEVPGQPVHRCVLFEHERKRRATEPSARRTALVSDLFALLRATLPEFLGSLSAAFVTTTAAAAVRAARTARRRRRPEPPTTQPPPAQE